MISHREHESIIEIEEEEEEQAQTEKIIKTQDNNSTTSSVHYSTTASNSPLPSTNSSPSHEFSFTLSLSGSTETAGTSPTTQVKQQAPLAIDLSPADEIFFHGHLLPLHFLSQLHASSPRSSTNSIDSSSLPVREISQEQKPTNSISADIGILNTTETQNSKQKPFSIFGLAKWRKGSESKEKQEKRKLKFDVSEFVKRYIRMVKPLLSPKGGSRRENYGVPRQSYSFSGSFSPRINNKREIRGSRGEFSAPASMITSPTNSGRLNPTSVPSLVSDSTMEELQSAVQAAIAHCKNSSSVHDKNTQQEILPVPVN